MKTVQLPKLDIVRRWGSADDRIEYHHDGDNHWQLWQGFKADVHDLAAIKKVEAACGALETINAAYMAYTTAYVINTDKLSPATSRRRYLGDYQVQGLPYRINRIHQGWMVSAGGSLSLSYQEWDVFETVFGKGVSSIDFPTRQAALEALVKWRTAYCASQGD
jgi:hypothetical protein